MSSVTAEDVRVWPYFVSLLVKVLAFLGTLHWPAGDVEFGVGVFLLLSCSFFMNSGLVNGFVLRLLFLSLVGLGVQFQCRLFVFGPGIDIWRSCTFLGAIFSCITYAAWWPW